MHLKWDIEHAPRNLLTRNRGPLEDRSLWEGYDVRGGPSCGEHC